MPGDPKECRRHAARCAELAVTVGTPQLRTTFLELSKNWERLAIQLEDAFAKLTESEAIESRAGESFSETIQLFSNLGTRKESAAVRLYFEWAANAGERAAAAVDEMARKFYQAMQSRWMKLAASTAVAERADLFLQTREFRLRLSPSDLCADCHQLMSLKAVEATAELEEHTFQCQNCGSTHTRRLRADDFPN
jgi:Zn finger protein HypA/HybF involved in hydrogenase expression